jgi:predicted dehydrogenase
LGSRHLRVLNGLPEVHEVVAVDSRLPAMPDYRHLVADGRGFTSLEDALASVDAVVVATHPTSHVRLGLQALAAGRHVLVEKPLTALLTEPPTDPPTDALANRLADALNDPATAVTS